MTLCGISDNCCILFHFYIKPQQRSKPLLWVWCCILFHFYIKPQPLPASTPCTSGCILFHFYIKPQLNVPSDLSNLCCILFHFYIKPQLSLLHYYGRCVVSYSISTSNHNFFAPVKSHERVVSYSISTSNHNGEKLGDGTSSLYLIPFLHQTTTGKTSIRLLISCILFHFYIKPQLVYDFCNAPKSCILFHFYIKPQLHIIS